MRAFRFLVGAVALAGSVSALALLPAHGADNAPANRGSAVNNLLECVAEHQQIAAVLLIDQSRSLRNTDKEGSRVQLSGSIVSALNAIASVPIDGNASRLDLLVVGFGSNVTFDGSGPPVESDWVSVVDSQSLQRTREHIDSFAGRTNDKDTDYVDALAQAQSLLTQHANTMDAQNPDAVCTAVLLFTDGSFDLTPSSSRRWWAQDLPINDKEKVQEALKRGTEELCKAKGLSDQLRRRSTYLLTFALLSDRFSGSEEGLLKGVTLGDGNCGVLSGITTGQYFAETGIDEITDCFLLTLVQGKCGDNGETLQCSEQSPCIETYVVDDSVAGFQLVIIAKPSLDTTILEGPSGATQILTSSAEGLELDGVKLSITSFNGRALVRGSIPAGTARARGEWSVKHAPAGGGSLRVQAALDSAYRLRLAGPQELIRGRESTGQLTVVGRSGTPVSGDAFLPPEIEVVILDGDRKTPAVLTEGDAPGTYTFPIVAPFDGTSPRVTIRAVGSVRLASGTTMDLAANTLTIDAVRAGFSRPPVEVQLGTLRAQRSKERNSEGVQAILPLREMVDGLTFTGADRGDSQVCFVKSDLLGAAESAPSLSSEDECISVSEGKSAAFPLTVTDPTPRAGQVGGSVRFRITSDVTEDAQVVDIPVRGSVLVALPDPFTDARRLWLLFAVAVLIPVLLYFGFAWYTAWFNEPTLVIAEPLPLMLRRSGLVAAEGQESTGRGDLKFLSSGSRRQASAVGLEFRSPIRLFRLPVAHVRPLAGGAAVLGSGGMTERRSIRGLFGSRLRSRGTVAHQLHGQWVFEPTLGAAAQDSIPGRLVLLLRGDVAKSKSQGEAVNARAKLIADASGELASKFESVLDLAGSTDKSPSGSDGDSSSPGYVSMLNSLKNR